jgi:hypothetical protein
VGLDAGIGGFVGIGGNTDEHAMVNDKMPKQSPAAIFLCIYSPFLLDVFSHTLQMRTRLV